MFVTFSVPFDGVCLECEWAVVVLLRSSGGSCIGEVIP
jgi:hypothetical protein